MPVSIFECALDRNTAELANFAASGLRGSDGSTGGQYKLKYNVVMQTLCGPRNVLAQSWTGSPHAVPSPWSTYSYQGDTDEHSYAQTYSVSRNPQSQQLYYVEVNFGPAAPEDVTLNGTMPV